jgi:hypothetical protein
VPLNYWHVINFCNKSLLDNPGFTPVGDIEFMVCDSDASGTSYNYLFAIGPRQRMEAARTARAIKLKNEEKYYDTIMSNDIVNTTWLLELNELNSIIIKGTTHDKGWLYGENRAAFK